MTQRPKDARRLSHPLSQQISRLLYRQTSHETCLNSAVALRIGPLACLAQTLVITALALAVTPFAVLAQTNAQTLPTKVLKPALKRSPLPLDELREESSPRQVTLMLSDLRGLLLIDEQKLTNAARVVALGDDFTIAATGDGILVEAPLNGPNSLLASLDPQTEVDIYHPGNRHAAKHAEQDKPAAVELEYVGKARLLDTSSARSAGQSAQGPELAQSEIPAASPVQTPRIWLQITQSKGVVRQGDLVFLRQLLSSEWLDAIQGYGGASQRIELQQAPSGLAGSVLSLFGARQWGARGDSVIIDLGAEDGLHAGMAISLDYHDVATPSAQALIYRATAHHAQALVLSAPSPVQVGSAVHTEAASQ